MTRTALILAGHGSHMIPATGGIVWTYVDQLRALGVADEVTACFWKEPPAFSQVLPTVAAEHIVIVPVFTTRGLFVNTVIPAEMGLTGARTDRDGQTIHYMQTLGEHPRLEHIVQQRVTDTLRDHQLDPNDVTVAVIGHGTRRDRSNQVAVRHQVDALRSAGLVAAVLDVYLEDDPAIPTIYTTSKTQHIIAVPFFLAPGSHASIDVPAALGLGTGQRTAVIKNHQVYYTDPIGTDDNICNLILEIARETGLPFTQREQIQPGAGFPRVGHDELMTAVQSAGTLTFGQLRLTAQAVEPSVQSDAPRDIDSLPELRQLVRDNPYRPLATSIDLPGGWRFALNDVNLLPAVVETVYPGVVADWAQHRNGAFQSESLAGVLDRQGEMFGNLGALTDGDRHDLIEKVCGQCVRQPTWHSGGTTADVIPCAAPCNVWLSKAQARQS